MMIRQNYITFSVAKKKSSLWHTVRVHSNRVYNLLFIYKMFKIKELREHRGSKTNAKIELSNYEKSKQSTPTSALQVIREARYAAEAEYIQITHALIRHRTKKSPE